MATAIETYYKGRYFRSRLEAKWAVFMDELNVVWEYEPEGYKNEDGECYLPDFFLPTLNCFLEIKPRKPTDSEHEKCWIAVQATSKDLFLLWGEPQDPWKVGQDNISGCYGLFHNDDEYIVSEARYWACCSECNKVGIVLFGATEKLHCCSKNPGHSLAPVNYEKVEDAAEKARNYRFGRIA